MVAIKMTLKGGKDLDAALNKLYGKAGRRKGSVDAGFMDTAPYSDGTGVATVAALNEFGNGNAPPRPFFRQTVSRRSVAWVKNLTTAVKNNKGDAAKSLDQIGQVMQEDIQKSINEFTSPPNAPSTIARKGFDKPLIDTSHMLNSVTFRVKSE